MPAPTRPPAPAAAAATLPLHRVRFFDHTPSPITALAFPPQPLPPARDPSSAGKGKARDGSERPEFGALIVARDNGEVEIWEYASGEAGGMGNWVLSKTLPPTLTHPTISLMALALRDPENFHTKPYVVPRVCDLRLFTAGSESTELTERCLDTGRVLQTYPIPSPPLWSMSVSPTQQLLCLTTNSPNLHFVQIPAPLFGGGLTALEPPPTHLLRSDPLPSRTRTVSVAWGVPKLMQADTGDWSWRDTYLLTGNSDSSFRRWTLPTPSAAGTTSGRVSIKGRAVVERIAKGKKNSHKGTIVWGVGVLPDGTFVTSDSLGNVAFWDPNTLAQKQSFRTHKADGMCMVIGPGGRTVFTSGPDQKVCQFTAVTQGNGSTQWALTATKRLHTHDVRALAIFPSYLPLPASNPLAPPPLNPTHAPILASGGWDMAPALTPAAPPDLLSQRLRNPLGKEKAQGNKHIVFEEAYPRRLSMFGGQRAAPRIAVSRGARLVVGRKERSVGIWRILEDEKGWEKVIEMDLRLRTNLISSAISFDGQWLAVSDLYETKLFRLVTGPSMAMKPVRVRDFVNDLVSSPQLENLNLAQRGCGASALLFTPDSCRLVLALAASAHTLVIELPADVHDGVEVVRSFAPPHKLAAGRSVLGGTRTNRRRRRKNAVTGGEDGDVEMADGDGSAVEVNGGDDSDEEGEEDEAPAFPKGAAPTPWITGMEASDDGQWLVTSDVDGKVTVFNLDTLQLHALLPTFSTAPVSVAFTPTHPLLAIVHATNTVQFYDLDSRRLLPGSNQLAALNHTLRGLHAGVLGASWEPSRGSPRAARFVLWSHDWFATVRLDLDWVVRPTRRGGGGGAATTNAGGASTPAPSEGGTPLSSKSLRRKRAREAREQLEASSASPSLASSDIAPASPAASTSLARMLLKPTPSSASDPDFVKVATDRFRAIVAADWLAEGELVLVERPYADFVGELPPQFWTGRYGRS